MIVRIDANLAPRPAMERALALIEESGLPMHEKIYEAARVLTDALRQMDYAERKG